MARKRNWTTSVISDTTTPNDTTSLEVGRHSPKSTIITKQKLKNWTMIEPCNECGNEGSSYDVYVKCGCDVASCTAGIRTQCRDSGHYAKGHRKRLMPLGNFVIYLRFPFSFELEEQSEGFGMYSVRVSAIAEGGDAALAMGGKLKVGDTIQEIGNNIMCDTLKEVKEHMSEDLNYEYELHRFQFLSDFEGTYHKKVTEQEKKQREKKS
jgi:hypothetical protein